MSPSLFLCYNKFVIHFWKGESILLDVNMIDLHAHTTASDGTLTPSELIDYAIEKQLKALAITDHDTIKGLMEGMAYLKKLSLPLELIPGIEFSTGLKGYDFDIHILGLFIDPHNKTFIEGLSSILTDRTNRNQSLIKKLNKLGYDISMEELDIFANGSIITRSHFASLLVEKGYFKDKNSVFNQLIGNGKPAYIPRENVSSKKVIELINSTGGISAIAHPTLYKLEDDSLLHMIGILKSYGLKAIESYYSLYDSRQHQRMRNIASHYDLLEVGGSDYHGDNKIGLDLGNGYGNLMVPDILLDHLKKHLLLP